MLLERVPVAPDAGRTSWYWCSPAPVPLTPTLEVMPVGVDEVVPLWAKTETSSWFAEPPVKPGATAVAVMFVPFDQTAAPLMPEYDVSVAAATAIVLNETV